MLALPLGTCKSHLSSVERVVSSEGKVQKLQYVRQETLLEIQSNTFSNSFKYLGIKSTSKYVFIRLLGLLFCHFEMIAISIQNAI